MAIKPVKKADAIENDTASELTIGGRQEQLERLFQFDQQIRDAERLKEMAKANVNEHNNVIKQLREERDELLETISSGQLRLVVTNAPAPTEEDDEAFTDNPDELLEALQESLDEPDATEPEEENQAVEAEAPTTDDELEGAA